MTWPFLAIAGAFLIQAVYWLLFRSGYRRAMAASRSRIFAEPGSTGGKTPMISVIVAARDEEKHIDALLESLSRQTYARHEVLIVDDGSTDRTGVIADAFAEAHPHFRVIHVADAVQPRKKHALTAGIAAAKGTVIATTDADCRPPDDWLQAHALHHRMPHSKTLVIGYSPFARASGILNRVSRYETFVTGFLTAAAVGLNRPYMAVGRNMSYSKDTFERAGGFQHSMHVLSGDDDLFVQHVAATKTADIEHLSDPRASVPTEAPDSWRQWLRQKRRHTSAARAYPRGVSAHLFLFHASSIGLWLAPLAGLPALSLLAGKLLLQWIVLARFAADFSERDLLWWFPFLEPAYALYNLVVAPIGVLSSPTEWRG